MSPLLSDRFVIPDLDLPAPRSSREVVYEPETLVSGVAQVDVRDIAPVELELEPARAHELMGPYGAFVATMAPSHVVPQPASAPTAGARFERFMDALAAFPIAIWKRVALYSFLVLLLGNTLRCRGLSASTNLALVALCVLGLAGVVASVQRSP